LAIVRAGLAAVDAAALVERAWPRLSLASATTGVSVVAVGKAGGPMAARAARLLGRRLKGGVISGIPPIDVEGFEVIAGGHPVPSENSQRAAQRALELVSARGPDDRVLVLLSGGASSLMALPAAGLTLHDKRQVTETLLRNGADIRALNTVRKHLSAVKGGWLAASTAAACDTVAISDVIGDDPSVIGSGPTVADASTFAEALAVMRAHGGLEAFSPRAVERLRRGVSRDVPETPKPGDRRLARSEFVLAGGRRDAMKGAAAEAGRLGYRVVVFEDPIAGEARTAAGPYLENVRRVANAGDRPLCVVSSGETTVHVRGHGVGGRNQELVLAVARAIGSLGPLAVFTSVGTDGIDGPTPAAGAIADASTVLRAGQQGLPPLDDVFEQNDAYRFFEPLGDLVRTGPTGTNVGDLQIMLIPPESGSDGQ
jgi:hydroxypyruvate reductase